MTQVQQPLDERRLRRPRRTLLLVVSVLGLVAAGAVPAAEGESAHELQHRGQPAPILPDLTPLRASGLYVTVAGDVRRLRFATSLGNVGFGPMEVRPNRVKPCAPGKRHASQVIYHDVDGNGRFDRDVDTTVTKRSAGCMVFHPQHHHWHFEAAARYRLFKAGTPDKTIGRARKTSFCLRDSQRMPPSYGTFHVGAYYGDCDRDTPQGISRGWSDIYEAFLPGQALRLPPRVRDDVYCLEVIVDPKGHLWEGDETDNTSVKAFRLVGGTTVKPVRKNAVCALTSPT